VARAPVAGDGRDFGDHYRFVVYKDGVNVGSHYRLEISANAAERTLDRSRVMYANYVEAMLFVDSEDDCAALRVRERTDGLPDGSRQPALGLLHLAGGVIVTDSAQPA
jgi:hypothetical protein